MPSLWFGNENSGSHIVSMFQCEKVLRVWLLSSFRFKPEVVKETRLIEIWNRMGGLDAKQDVLGMLASVCWSIWRARNDWVFKKLRMEEVRISDRAATDYNEYCQSVDVVINGEEDQMEGDTQAGMDAFVTKRD